MAFMRLVVLFVLIAVAVSAKRRGKTARRKLEVEILTKESNTVTARFRQYRGVKRYFVDVRIKHLADASSDFVITLKRTDRAPDGFYYIDANNTLQPGHLYQISVFNRRKMNQLGSVDFFADCDSYSYQCTGSWGGQTCLSPEELCNGVATCANGSDEETNEDGSCVISLPERPTPPPPPANAPCILALNAAKDSVGSELPECGPDGNYAVMRCGGVDTFSCYCLHPLTGETLHTQPDFNPFVNWDYREKCIKRRNAALATAAAN